MSNDQAERIRDRNALIQSGYQGPSGSGSNPLAGPQPSLTEHDIRRVERSVDGLNLTFNSYAEMLAGLQNVLSPDGFLSFDPIMFGGSAASSIVFVQGTVVLYSNGAGTATVGTQTVSFTNTTALGILNGDVVLLGMQSGTYYLVGIISRSGTYTPPSYIAPSYTGFPLNGLVLGSGIKQAHSVTSNNRTFVDFDETGALGLGTNCIVGLFNNNGAFKVIAHSITTATTADLSWPAGFTPAANTPPQMMIIGDAIVLKLMAAAQPLYVWRLSTGWVTANTPGGASDRFSRMTVSGADYIVVSRSGAGWYYYNIATATWSGVQAFPSGATRVFAKGGYMWTHNGYVAAASLSPTWTLRHSGLNVATAMDNLQADVAENGDLVVLTQFTGPPTTWGITIYNYSTSTSTSKAQLFSTTGAVADGEPQSLYNLSAGNGYIAIAGIVRADVVNPTLSTTESSGAVWVSDGISTATRAAQEASTNYTAAAENAFAGGYIRGTKVASQVGLFRTIGSTFVSSTLNVQTF